MSQQERDGMMGWIAFIVLVLCVTAYYIARLILVRQ